MREKDDRFRIGEFAKLCGVTKDTLFHYERMGLIQPDHIDFNGYRYYSAAQFFHMEMIKALKESGLPLAQIREFKKYYNVSQYLSTLRKQQVVLKSEIARLQNLSNMLDDLTRLTSESIEEPLDTPKLVEYGELYLITWETANARENCETTPEKDVSEVSQLLKYCATQEIKPMQPVGGIIARERLLAHDFASNYCCFRVGQMLDDEHLFVRPAGTYVTLLHRDLYHGQREAYRLLFRFIEENDLTIIGNSYESEVVGYLSAGKPEDFIVQYSIQVKTK